MWRPDIWCYHRSGFYWGQRFVSCPTWAGSLRLPGFAVALFFLHSSCLVSSSLLLPPLTASAQSLQLLLHTKKLWFSPRLLPSLFLSCLFACSPSPVCFTLSPPLVSAKNSTFIPVPMAVKNHLQNGFNWAWWGGRKRRGEEVGRTVQGKRVAEDKNTPYICDNTESVIDALI